MPVNRHLEFAEIRDFTPGIFTVGDWLIPANGAQTLTDLHPEPAGGLRAAMKATSFSTTGLTQTNERVIGIYARGGIALRSGAAGDASDRYVWTYDSSAHTVKVYRWDETNAVATWSLIKTHAAVNATPNPVIADTFVDSTGAAYVVYTLAQTSADDGLWSIAYSTGTVTKQLGSIFPIGMAVQDDRIIVADVETLRWSDSQSVSSFPSANNLPVQASRQGNGIMSITAFAPSDLLIGARYSPWVLVEGDITDPVVRSMSDARTVGWGQRAAVTEHGLAFVSPNQGIFITGTGESFQDISTQLDRSTFVSASGGLIGDVGGGNLAYIGPFLLAPHGYVYDERTESWYRLSDLIGAKDHFHSWADINNRQFFVATGDVAYKLWTYDSKESSRAVSGTWKSAPLRSPDGRQIEIREVQIATRSYNTGSTITVTVNGTARAATLEASKSQTVSFLFKERAEVLDVQVAVASNGSAEAPSIEAVRIGQGKGHQTY